jgi:hypothetical protein
LSEKDIYEKALKDLDLDESDSQKDIEIKVKSLLKMFDTDQNPNKNE